MESVTIPAIAVSIEIMKKYGAMSCTPL